jgi:hypothetical protein
MKKNKVFMLFLVLVAHPANQVQAMFSYLPKWFTKAGKHADELAKATITGGKHADEFTSGASLARTTSEKASMSAVAVRGQKGVIDKIRATIEDILDFFRRQRNTQLRKSTKFLEEISPRSTIENTQTILLDQNTVINERIGTIIEMKKEVTSKLQSVRNSMIIVENTPEKEVFSKIETQMRNMSILLKKKEKLLKNGINLNESLIKKVDSVANTQFQLQSTSIEDGITAYNSKIKNINQISLESQSIIKRDEEYLKNALQKIQTSDSTSSQLNRSSTKIKDIVNPNSINDRASISRQSTVKSNFDLKIDGRASISRSKKVTEALVPQSIEKNLFDARGEINKLLDGNIATIDKSMKDSIKKAIMDFDNYIDNQVKEIIDESKKLSLQKVEYQKLDTMNTRVNYENAVKEYTELLEKKKKINKIYSSALDRYDPIKKDNLSGEVANKLKGMNAYSLQDQISLAKNQMERTKTALEETNKLIDLGEKFKTTNAEKLKEAWNNASPFEREFMVKVYLNQAGVSVNSGANIEDLLKIIKKTKADTAFNTKDVIQVDRYLKQLGVSMDDALGSNNAIADIFKKLELDVQTPLASKKMSIIEEVAELGGQIAKDADVLSKRKDALKTLLKKHMEDPESYILNDKVKNAIKELIDETEKPLALQSKTSEEVINGVTKSLKGDEYEWVAKKFKDEIKILKTEYEKIVKGQKDLKEAYEALLEGKANEAQKALIKSGDLNEGAAAAYSSLDTEIRTINKRLKSIKKEIPDLKAVIVERSLNNKTPATASIARFLDSGDTRVMPAEQKEFIVDVLRKNSSEAEDAIKLLKKEGELRKKLSQDGWDYQKGVAYNKYEQAANTYENLLDNKKKLNDAYKNLLDEKMTDSAYIEQRKLIKDLAPYDLDTKIGTAKTQLEESRNSVKKLMAPRKK